MIRGSVALTGSASGGGDAALKVSARGASASVALTGSARDERRKGRWQYLQV